MNIFRICYGDAIYRFLDSFQSLGMTEQVLFLKSKGKAGNETTPRHRIAADKFVTAVKKVSR